MIAMSYPAFPDYLQTSYILILLLDIFVDSQKDLPNILFKYRSKHIFASMLAKRIHQIKNLR